MAKILTLLVEFEDADKLPAFFEQFARRTRDYGHTGRHEQYTTPDGLRVAVMLHDARPSTTRGS